MRLIIIVFCTVSCLIGVSFATVNSTCSTTKPCNNATQNEICENGYCKIKIEGTCTVDQTQTTEAPPITTGSTGSTTSATTNTPAKSTTPITTNATSATTPKTNATTLNPNATTPATGRKRRDASSSITITQECVENSLCTMTASIKKLTCQCMDGYTKEKNGSCQQNSSASSLRTGFFASVIVAFLMFISL